MFLAALAALDKSRGSVQLRPEIPAHQKGPKSNFRALALVRHPPGPYSLVAGGTASLVFRAGPGVSIMVLYMYIESGIRYLLHLHDDRR